jgi:hypothetical protein
MMEDEMDRKWVGDEMGRKGIYEEKIEMKG